MLTTLKERESSVHYQQLYLPQDPVSYMQVVYDVRHRRTESNQGTGCDV